MRMKPKILAGLIILFLFFAMIPPVSGNGWPEEQTRHIQAPPPELGKDTDMFVTESGIGFHTELVTVLDPNMDIYGYLFFRDIKLNSYFYLENATLRLHTASTLDFDNESSFTIYGINDYIYFGMGEWGYGSPGEIMSAPLTSAHVNYNSSQFYGHQWWEIDVTNIVQELKSNPWYEGPGLDFNDPGDYMAFIILGAGGHDTRYFYDLRAGNGYEAQLHLHWDFSPPPPEGYEEAEFVEDYGNYTIWFLPGQMGLNDYVWLHLVDPTLYLKYTNLEGTLGPFTIDSSTEGVAGRILVHTSDGRIYVVYGFRPGTYSQIYSKRSLDNGTTWVDKVLLSTSPGMSSRHQYAPVIAVDSNNNLHVVWEGNVGGDVQIYYVNHTDSWSTPLIISIQAGSSGNGDPALAVDSYDNLHVSWIGRSTEVPLFHQVFYSNCTDSWSTPLIISTDPDMDLHDHFNPEIAINSENDIHISWAGRSEGYPDADQIWHINKTMLSPWGPITRISTESGSKYNAVIAVDSDGYPHVVWGSSYYVRQIYENHYNGTDWVGPVDISTDDINNENMNTNPTISIDSNNTRYVLWRCNYDLYFTKYIDGWTPPTIAQGQLHDHDRACLRFPIMDLPGHYFITDPNGTVIMDNGNTINSTDIQDVYDWIDIEDPDPEDPDPPGWVVTGYFTRFKMRLYFLATGFGCLFGPVLFFAWRRPSGYYLMCGAIVMLIGLGMLLSIGQV